MKKIVWIFLGILFFMSGCGIEKEEKESEYVVDSEVGKLSVVAYNDEDFIADMNVVVEFFDKDGNLIDTNYKQIIAVEPGMEVAVVLYNEPNEYEDYEVTVEKVESVYKSYIKDIEVTDKLENGIIYGEITNKSDNLVDSVYININFYKDNEIINVIDTFIENIEGNGVGEFQFAIPLDEDLNTISYDKYEVVITSAYSLTNEN